MSVFVRINRSQDSEYHTQRNNEEIPFSACNTTAYVMAAKQAGIEIPNVPDGTQPEDYFTRHMLSGTMYSRMIERFPWTYTNKGGELQYRHRPSEIHELLAEGFNELVGKQVAKFYLDKPWADLIWAVVKGYGVVLSGTFPYRGGTLNHVVSLAGFTTSQSGIEKLSSIRDVDPAAVTEWEIDDPFGDVHTDYRDHHGNNVKVTPEQWCAWMKVVGSPDENWAHIIRK